MGRDKDIHLSEKECHFDFDLRNQPESMLLTPALSDKGVQKKYFPLSALFLFELLPEHWT